MHFLTHVALLGIWPFLQLVSCLAIILSVLTFRRGESRHRHLYAWMAWIYVVVCTAVSIKLVFGIKPPPGPFEALATFAIAWLFLYHQGNTAHLVRSITAAATRVFQHLVTRFRRRSW